MNKSVYYDQKERQQLAVYLALVTCWLRRCLQLLFLILRLLCLWVWVEACSHRRWLVRLFVHLAFPLSVRGWKEEGIWLQNFDLYNPQISTHLRGSSLCVWSYVVSFRSVLTCLILPLFPLCRVQGKRKRDSYVRVLGWPVKAPLFPALWSARLTSSSWSAAYVWTATKTPKYCPAYTPSVRGECVSYHAVLM